MKKILIKLTPLFLVAACMAGSPPADFYMIAPANRSEVAAISNKSLAITVDVNIPGYLSRPQIVTRRDADTELRLSEFNRWLEPLEISLQRVIAENLASLMPKAKIKASSMGMGESDYRVLVNIDRFDGRLGDKVSLKTWWSLIDKNNNTIFFDDVTFEVEVGKTYNDFVQKQSDLIKELSLVIAKRIIKM